MKIYRLESPWSLFFLIFPTLCIAVVIFSRFFIKKGVKITGVSELFSGFSITSFGYLFSIILIITGLYSLAFSLSKPQYGIKKEKIITEGIDIMIALDTSLSMTQNDFLKQTRIEGAKNILKNFIEKRKGDRIGIVTFAASSILKCPATLNSDLLTSVISNIQIDRSKESSNRTAIGIGLSSAINRIIKIDNIKKANETENTNKVSKSRLIILVTDGENNAGEISPATAAEIAYKSGIKIYTVGIGNPKEVDLELLKNISKKTSGTFFHAITSGELGSIFEEINKIEKHKIETFEYTNFNNIGYIFVVIGIILLISGLLLNSLFFKRLS